MSFAKTCGWLDDTESVELLKLKSESNSPPPEFLRN